MEIIPSISFRGERPVVVSEGRYKDFSQMGDQTSVWEILKELEDYERFYLIDIDGIERNRLQSEVIRKLSTRKELWADTGARNPEGVTDAYIAGADRVVISTKTLTSWDMLERSVDLSDRIIMGIDYKDGVISSIDEIEGENVESMLERGLDLGINTFVISNFSDSEFDIDMLKYLPEGDYSLYLGGVDRKAERYYPERVDGLILGLEEAIDWIKTN